LTRSFTRTEDERLHEDTGRGGVCPRRGGCDRLSGSGHGSGSLDLSFSGDGRTRTSLGYDDYAYGAPIQPHGGIVLAGESTSNLMALAR
jgi:hypothetical protein